MNERDRNIEPIKNRRGNMHTFTNTKRNTRMKTLILYYSFTQNNEKLAAYLGQQLHCDMEKIETVGKRTFFSIVLDLVFDRKPKVKPIPCHLRDYDQVIFCSPIWAGKIAAPLKSYLIGERGNVPQYSFITVCGGSLGQKEKIIRELSSIVGKEPRKVMELLVSDLLPPGEQSIKKSSSAIRIDAGCLSIFERQLRDFVQEGDPALSAQ